MTVAVPTAGKPFTLTGRSEIVQLAGVDLTCLTNHLKIAPNVTKETAKTICGSVDYPGTVQWLFGLTLYQSFEDETATYQVLQGAVDGGVPVPYLVRPHARPAGPDNPEFTGLVNPEPFTIFDSDAGALVTVQFEWSCTDEPTVDLVVGGMAMSASAAGEAKAARNRGGHDE